MPSFRKLVLALFLLSAGMASAQVPNYQFRMLHWDDFMGGLLTTGNIGSLGWSFTSTGTGSGITYLAGACDANRCGILRDTAGTTNPSRMILRLSPGGVGTVGVLRGDQSFKFVWMIKLGASGASTLARLGITSDATAAQAASGIWFEKLGADNNWFGVTRSASSQTRTAALAATGTAWVRLSVWRKDASTISFQVNDDAVVDLAATIPTGELQPFALIDNNASTTGQSMYIDSFIIGVINITR